MATSDRASCRNQWCVAGLQPECTGKRGVDAPARIDIIALHPDIGAAASREPRTHTARGHSRHCQLMRLAYGLHRVGFGDDGRARDPNVGCLLPSCACSAHGAIEADIASGCKANASARATTRFRLVYHLIYRTGTQPDDPVSASGSSHRETGYAKTLRWSRRLHGIGVRATGAWGCAIRLALS